MIDRRDLLIGGAAVAAAAVSYGLRPRRQLTLLGREKMEAIIPASVPGWAAAPSEGLVKPKVEGLAAKLYSEVVQRAYINQVNGAEIMLLIAYGGTQSDMLQLHRPEVCYPAVGFQLESKRAHALSLPGGGVLPTVQVVAVAGDRRENIAYWTRLGEDLPTDSAQQRAILLKDAMHGFVPDGVLVRASVVHDDPSTAFNMLNTFIPALVAGVPAPHRRALVGTRAADAMRTVVA